MPTKMLKVHKYQTALDGPFDLELPEHAQILHFGPQQVMNPPYQAVGMYLWALIDPHAGMVKRRFWITATGRPLPQPDRHIGTATVGGYVFHLFEMPAKPVLHALGGEEIDLDGE